MQKSIITMQTHPEISYEPTAGMVLEKKYDGTVQSFANKSRMPHSLQIN